MTEPRKIKARLLDARYVKEAKSVLLFLECEKGQFKSQIHRDAIATFGSRTEDQIEQEMKKYVELLKCSYVGRDKYINAVFDSDLNDKLKDNVKIKY